MIFMYMKVSLSSGKYSNF